MLSLSKDSIIFSDREDLEHKIGEIVERIKNLGRKRKLLAGVLKKAKGEFEFQNDEKRGGFIESALVKSVGQDSLSDCTVAGVDGGVLKKPLHGFDLILFRAVAAIFCYEDGSLQNADYCPSGMPPPQLMSIDEPLDSREFELLVAMRRQLAEMERAKETAENWDVDAIFLDGSIVPQYVSPASESKTSETYGRLIDSFKGLYKTCDEKGAPLIGVLKDSRSARFIKIFQRKVLPRLMDDSGLSASEISLLEGNKSVLSNSRDINFLDELLDRNERSFTFPYAESQANLLDGLGEWKKKIYAFYLKSVPYDCPLRVEFLSGSKDVHETVDRISALVNALSAHHEACAFPPVLIEADACARLPMEEISIIRDNIADRLEPSSILDLRRDRRPF